MEGYLKSLSTNWRHIFKQAVRPGGKIPLSELYAVYGKKHKLSDGEEFVTWLRTVKLKGLSDTWSVITMDDKVPDDLVSKPSKVEEKLNPTQVKELTVEGLVGLSVRQARETIPTVTDLKLLKYALQEARPRANKDSLCRLIEKRIKEVQIAR